MAEMRPVRSAAAAVLGCGAGIGAAGGKLMWRSFYELTSMGRLGCGRGAGAAFVFESLHPPPHP